MWNSFDGNMQMVVLPSIIGQCGFNEVNGIDWADGETLLTFLDIFESLFVFLMIVIGPLS